MMDEVRPGDKKISARVLNDAFDGGELTRKTSVMGGHQKTIRGGGRVIDARRQHSRKLLPIEFAVFILKDVTTYKDAIIGKQVGTGSEIAIAKPYLLRRTPFEEDGRDGVTYVYESNSERTATKEDSSETQKITPDYILDDEIVAARFIVGSFLDGELAPLEWIDFNLDGREWAVV